MQARYLKSALVAGAVSLALASCGTGQSGLAVKVSERIPVQQASLYLEVRGSRSDAPVLLWLHGGPGGAERPLFELFNGDLEQSFRVAYYDQRGAGRSFDPAAPAGLLTVDRHLADLQAIVERLKAEQRVSRVTLVGHSWGSLLAIRYAQQHPENVAAVVGVSQVVAPLENQKEQWHFVAQAAAVMNDSRSLSQLRQIGPPPLSGAAELRLGRLVDRFGGTWQRRPSYAWAMVRAIGAGLIKPGEISRFIRANERSVAAMTPELLRTDLRRQAPQVQVPVVLFLGRFDHQISTATARAYEQALRSPAKSFLVFARSAHNIPFEEPQAFSACLRASLKSLGRAEFAGLQAGVCPYRLAAR